MGASQKRDTQQESVFHQLEAIQALQAQLRLNLGARGKSDREVAIRDRLLDDLAAMEVRPRGNRAGAQRLVEQQPQEREARQHAALTDLFGER